MKRILLLLMTLLLVSMPLYAQKSFDMRYSEAVEYYTTKQYDLAIKTLESAKKAPGVTKDQIGQADRLIRQCRSALTKLADLNLSKETLLIPGAGMRDSIYVTAGKKWEVTATPDWCSTSVDADVLHITVDPNPLDEPRKGVIEVSMGKERTAYVLINQDAKREITHTVHIRTVPERSIISIDQNTGMLADQFSLSEGEHHVRIEKNGFERIDTVLVVPRNPSSSDLYHRIELTPAFAMLSVDIKPEEGLYFDSVTKLDISGIPVNLQPSQVKSFNVDQEISYYNIYEGNVIPLHPGQYVIRAESDGFKFGVQNIKIDKGEKVHLDFTLSAIYGRLTVQDAENATGARLFIDEREVGEVPFTGKVKTGHHILRVEKDGFLPEYERYEFDIDEEKEHLLNLSLKQYVTYHITSDPAYCKVSVNGEPAGTTPLNIQLREGYHKLHYEKEGYFSWSEEVVAQGGGEQDHHISLEKTYPLVVSSDADSLRITITKGQGKNRVVYVDNVKTPGIVELPASKSLYHVQLTRSNLTKAYDGYFWHRGQRERLNLLTYSREDFHILGVNYYLKRPAPCFPADNKLAKNFQRIGDVSLAELRIFHGLTTSVAKASIFWQTDPLEKIYYYNSKGNLIEDILLGGNNADLYSNTTFIPALSILFLNGEFRLGGAVHNNADICLMTSYAWYPPLTKILPLTHMSGHDAFLGGEISSRIPIFNVNLKAGVQLFYGQANILAPNGAIKTTMVSDRYYSEPYVVPFHRAEFVVTLGIKLGDHDSKGNNILRVF